MGRTLQICARMGAGRLPCELERTVAMSATTTTIMTVRERGMARRTLWMSLVVLTRNLIPVLWVCRCCFASTCREASDALSKSSANCTCLPLRLHTDYSSHLDSWHGRQESSNRLRPEQRHLREVAASLLRHANVRLQGRLPHHHARLIVTANVRQRTP